MPQFCMGFEVHQPFRLNRMLDPAPKAGRKDLIPYYFDNQANREILLRIAEKCYDPATRLILGKLDEGFSCSFSFSGTLIEQLDRWSPDTLALFEQVARHKNAELIAQTYYHSIASCFTDKMEFRDQVLMHARLMEDRFHRSPAVFENTEFTFNNEIAAEVKDMGFSGAFTEGVSRILGWRSPNFLYRCGGLPILLRNTALSDDIAFRFGNRSWDKFPLTADRYAEWVAGSPGDVVTVFLDYETFGEHFWKETGIFEFMRSLPGELAARDVSAVLPSVVIAGHSPADELSIRDTISWADLEKDTSAWMGNERQLTAFHAVQAAREFADNMPLWRYLLTSDHFYYMASKYGTCGEVHSYFSPHSAEDAFTSYMQVLADYESRTLRVRKKGKPARALRTVRPEEAFHFSSPAGYIGQTAFSLDQLCDLLPVVPADSIAFHQGQGDISRWIRSVLGDEILAEDLRNVRERHEMIQVARRRQEELWNRSG